MNRSRLLVLTTLQREQRHLSATEIWDLIRLEGEPLSLATIYNSLRSLLEAGAVKEIQRPGEGSVFDSRVDPHAHLLCTACGRMSDIDVTRGVSALEREAHELSGYRGLRSEITLHGICPACVTTRTAGPENQI